jgi:hypothetical protein
MKTIKHVFEEFLKEQRVRLKPSTYRGYEDAIYIFEQCLNSYAYQYLDDKDNKLFDNQNYPREDFTESVEGYFRLIKIEPRKLWLEDYIFAPPLKSCLTAGLQIRS